LIIYYDTSALVKLLIPEEGSELVEKLWGSAYTGVSSILSYPEGRAALAAAHRAGRLPQRGYRRSLQAFEELSEELVSIGVDREVAQLAGRQATEHGLRGYDAVHLASALDLGEEELVFVTWDEDLRRAANAAGLGTAGSSGW
jgi:predicted nucleic acid-binding protein